MLSPDVDSEEGENGSVGMVGGRVELSDPSALAGLAALRIGSDVAKAGYTLLGIGVSDVADDDLFTTAAL